jgi:uncharacterized OB-fold protein
VSDAPSLAPSAHFREALERGSLELQRCASCASSVFPPRVLCPVCSSQDLEWHRSEGVGTVYSASTLQPRDAAPYTVLLVDLDDGARVMAVTPGTSPGIGARIRVSVERDDEMPRLVAQVER